MQRRTGRLPLDARRGFVLTLVPAQASARRLCDDDGRTRSPPSAEAYVAAWLTALGLVVGVVTYLLAYASQIGNKATNYWLCDLAVMVLLFYGLLETLFVAATSVYVPGLLKEHYVRFSDPLTTKQYAYQQKLPTVGTFALVTWHEELGDTRVGRHCLGEATGARRDGATRVDFEQLAADASWQPSLAARASIALAAFVVNLPYELQQSIFEELFLCFWGIVTALAFGTATALGGAKGPGGVFLIYVLTRVPVYECSRSHFDAGRGTSNAGAY